MNERKKYYLGLDNGGTTTKAALFTPDGKKSPLRVWIPHRLPFKAILPNATWKKCGGRIAPSFGTCLQKAAYKISTSPASEYAGTARACICGGKTASRYGTGFFLPTTALMNIRRAGKKTVPSTKRLSCRVSTFWLVSLLRCLHGFATVKAIHTPIFNGCSNVKIMCASG